MSEGSVWEAMSFASYYQLDNLVAILDINRLGQSDPAPLQHHVEKYQKRCEAFGWVLGESLENVWPRDHDYGPEHVNYSHQVLAPVN